MPKKRAPKTLTLGEWSDYIKACRKGSREAEITLYGHPLPKHSVHKSKKTYNRKLKHKNRDVR